MNELMSLPLILCCWDNEAPENNEEEDLTEDEAEDSPKLCISSSIRF